MREKHCHRFTRLGNNFDFQLELQTCTLFATCKHCKTSQWRMFWVLLSQYWNYIRIRSLSGVGQCMYKAHVQTIVPKYTVREETHPRILPSILFAKKYIQMCIYCGLYALLSSSCLHFYAGCELWSFMCLIFCIYISKNLVWNAFCTMVQLFFFYYFF